jgi:hypothetical protein
MYEYIYLANYSVWTELLQISMTDFAGLNLICAACTHLATVLKLQAISSF